MSEASSTADTVQFSVTEADDGFYVTVSDELTVYEAYDDAVADIGDVLDEDDDAFLAEMSIDTDSEDVNVNLEQVPWPQVIQDME